MERSDGRGTGAKFSAMNSAALGRSFLIPLVLGWVVLEAHYAGAVAWRWPIWCFFDATGSELTERCRLIVKETVDSWQRERAGRELTSDNVSEGLVPPYTARFQIRGYAQDGRDSEQNYRLSRERAETVAAELKRLGVPIELMTIHAFGDVDPLVPSSPMDPQNRGVQIVLY